MGIPMLRGRTFNDSLRLEQAREIIISEGFATNFFPGEEPLGKHLKTGGDSWSAGGKIYTIVGVVGDMRYDIGEAPKETKYFSAEGGNRELRHAGDPLPPRCGNAGPAGERVIQGMDRDLPVADVLTMDQLLGK